MFRQTNFTYRLADAGQILMGGQQYHAAPLRMLFKKANQLSYALFVDRRQRLIEDPQRRRAEPQPRQCHAPLLPGGQLRHRQILVTHQPHLLRARQMAG